jgi:hypothetical protein
MADHEVVSRVMAVVADPDAHPLPPREGPNRAQLLALLAGESAA